MIRIQTAPHISKLFFALLFLLAIAASAYAQGIWKTKASISSPRFMWAAAEMNGELYVAGGWVGCTPYSTLEAYNPLTNMWIPRASMPTARGYLAAGVLNGLLYTVGGSVNCGVDVSNVEAYDPVSNSWAIKAPLPIPMSSHGVGVVNGILYVIGSSTTGDPRTVFAYNPATNSWTAKAPMPTARTGHAVAAANGIIYAIGGQAVNSGYAGTAIVEAYDPATDTWTAKAPMSRARIWSFAAGVVNGIVYVAGGFDPNAGVYLATVEAYDPATDTWSTVASMPTARTAPAGGVLNGVFYAIGGFNSSGYRATVEAFTPPPLVPVDLNGAYFGPNAGQAIAATKSALYTAKVIETSGGSSAALGTFTPFSLAVKPPSDLQVDPFDHDFSAYVSASSWSSNDLFRFGQKSISLAGEVSVTIDKPSAGFRFKLVSTGPYTSPGYTDTTGATSFLITASVSSTGIPSARGETVDGSAPGTVFAIGTGPTPLAAGSDYAFFVAMDTGGASQARAVVSNFMTNAIPNALFAFCDDPYVKNTESIYYRLGMADLGAWMYGFQGFLQSVGAQTFSSNAYTPSPFASHFLTPTGVALDYAGDTGIGGSPVASNATLATTTFSTGADGTASLEFNPLHVPVSRFGDGSISGINANTVNSNIVVIDTVAPVSSAFVVIEGGPNLIGGPTATQGTLNISANVSDAASGLTAKPDFYLVKPVGSPVLLTSSPGNANNFTATYNLLPSDPCGVYKIRVVATDDAGNTSTTDSGTFSVNVATVNLTISLGATDASVAFTRGVVIVIGGTGGGNTPVTISKDVIFNTAGNGNVILTANDGVPCDSAISRISVKDRKHTLRKNVAFGPPVTNQYTVTVPLQGGDASDDNVIDIIDYGIFASKFGQNLGANTLGTAPPTMGTVHPDFSGNGIVGTADYTYIQTQFLSIGDNEPGSYRPAPQPKKQATVKEMYRAGVKQAAEMDRNHDGWITYQEISDWLWR